ncbi:MAG TPA: hypothetical protein VKF32_14850 [Thermoanaerobaculia bacterium]|nr:hypothetical protein [Thermoanaerobaculia bacterium]
MLERLYAPPRDRLHLSANDARLLDLADRLWERAEAPPGDAVRVSVRAFPGAEPEALAERRVAWRLGASVYEVAVEGLLAARLDLSARTVDARVSEALLASDPGLAARLLLEAPAAVFLSRRAWCVLHAGAVFGTRGAVVLRGASGSGKSTLVAAAMRAGLRVLADESLLVARADTDELSASVRDLTLLHDSVELLGILDSAPAFSGGEEKRRVDLFRSSAPALRRARRAATFLLGPRTPGPARLAALTPDEFLAEFRKGAIPQERIASDPDVVGLDWRCRNGFRLDGASDLAGAVELIQMHAGRTSDPTRPGGEARG